MNEIIGNEPIKRYLKQMVNSGRIGQSFLFSGQEGIGKSLFAQALAKELICIHDPHGHHARKLDHGTHPDLHHLRTEGKVGMHSIEALRRFQEEIHMPPYEAPWKIFIVHEADRMLPTSANALLKSFEEPPKQTVIILLTSSPEEILGTILSRCNKIYFQPLTQQEIFDYLIKKGILEERAKKASRRADGSLSHALALCEEKQNSLDGLLKYLSKQDSGYMSLKAISASLGEQFDSLRKSLEEESQALYSQEFMKSLSVAQREVYEKEIQGAVSLRFHREVKDLFNGLLGWFRDSLPGQNNENLYFPEYRSNLILKEDKFLKIQKAVEEALLSVERFMPLSFVLESLLIKIQMMNV